MTAISLILKFYWIEDVNISKLNDETNIKARARLDLANRNLKFCLRFNEEKNYFLINNNWRIKRLFKDVRHACAILGCFNWGKTQ